MKLGILIAGFCRPNKKYCVENISLLKNSFKGFNYTTVYVDDNNPNSRYVANNAKVKDVILISRQDDHDIIEKFPYGWCKNARKGWCSQANIWRLREKINIGLSFIKENYKDITHICYSRPCMRVEIDPVNFKQDRYYVRDLIDYDPDNGDHGAVDDRFGFAPIDLFSKVWSQDKKLLDRFPYVSNHEEFLKLVVDQEKIPVEQQRFKTYIIRPE